MGRAPWLGQARGPGVVTSKHLTETPRSATEIVPAKAQNAAFIKFKHNEDDLDKDGGGTRSSNIEETNLTFFRPTERPISNRIISTL